MKNKTVYVVHAVDTEGPLYESIRANFERIHELFGHKIEPNIENLRKLQNKKINLNGDEDRVQRILSSKRIDTHENWGQINLMLDLITSDKFRDELKDSFDGGWIFNWFCMCHVGITGENPRRRDIGYHNIYDYYREYFDKNNDNRDLIQWHYHALSLTNDANRAGSTYLNSNHIYNIISRMIIDRSFFPSVFRAGHVTERPDSHFFLEQWIPFDYSNSSHPDNSDSTSSPARFGNWLRAPVSWIPYHPGHDDYQIPGTCRRFIARCLPMDERAYSIKYDDVKKAYDEADKYGTSILSFTNHDFRNMAPDIIKVRELIKDCDQKYPNVKFKYSNAIDAMRAVSNVTNSKKIGFDVVLKNINHMCA